MDVRIFRIAAGLALAAAFPAQAEEGSVSISSPVGGAKLDAMAENRIVYQVVPGPRGDHTHLYVDGREVAVLRRLSGSHPLETLAPGGHDLCIKVVNKAHTPIGVQQCVKVRAD